MKSYEELKRNFWIKWYKIIFSLYEYVKKRLIKEILLDGEEGFLLKKTGEWGYIRSLKLKDDDTILVTYNFPSILNETPLSEVPLKFFTSVFPEIKGTLENFYDEYYDKLNSNITLYSELMILNSLYM